jgi:hypothetical protein
MPPPRAAHSQWAAPRRAAHLTRCQQRGSAACAAADALERAPRALLFPPFHQIWTSGGTFHSADAAALDAPGRPTAPRRVAWERRATLPRRHCVSVRAARVTTALALMNGWLLCLRATRPWWTWRRRRVASAARAQLLRQRCHWRLCATHLPLWQLCGSRCRKCQRRLHLPGSGTGAVRG